MPHSSPGLAAATSSEEPGWAMAPSNAAAAGFTARGSWLLEPDTGTGMLLYPREWTFTERRDVTAHLRQNGWAVVPVARFLHLTSDGTTAIRLLSRLDDAEVVADIGARVIALQWATDAAAAAADAAREASV